MGQVTPSDAPWPLRLCAPTFVVLGGIISAPQVSVDQYRRCLYVVALPGVTPKSALCPQSSALGLTDLADSYPSA